MNPTAFLAELRGRGIRLSVEAGRLRCSAPAGALTSELREELRARKAELVEFLRDAATIARHPEAIVPMQPRGSGIPVFGVGGHTGDFFAYQDLVRQLTASGTEVRFVALFGCPHPTLYGFNPWYWLKRIVGHGRVLATLPSFREQREYVAGRMRARLQAMRDERTPPGGDLVSRLRFEFGHATIAALRRHTPLRYSGGVCLFLPNHEWYRESGAALRWRREAPRGEEYYGPHSVDPDRMLVDPHAAAFAALFNTALRNAEAAAPASPRTRLVRIICFDSSSR